MNELRLVSDQMYRTPTLLFSRQTTSQSRGEPTRGLSTNSAGQRSISAGITSAPVSDRSRTETCPAQLSKRIERFAIRERMDIAGLGEKMADALVGAGLVTKRDCSSLLEKATRRHRLPCASRRSTFSFLSSPRAAILFRVCPEHLTRASASLKSETMVQSSAYAVR